MLKYFLDFLVGMLALLVDLTLYLMGNPYMVMVTYGKIDATSAMGDPYMVMAHNAN